MTKRGRPAKIQAAERTILVEIVRCAPLATREEICTEFTRRTGGRDTRPDDAQSVT